MDIRDWLAIIVIIFIVLILLDGFRRKWFERKTRIRVKLDKNIPPASGDEDADIVTKSELPSGGARIKPRISNRGAEEVPVLMDSVDIGLDDIEEYSAAENDWEEQDIMTAADAPENAGEETDFDEDDNYPDDRDNDFDEDRIEPTFGDEELTFGRDDQGELKLEDHDLFEHGEHGKHEEGNDSQDDIEQEQVEEVIIVNVMSKPGHVIEGRRLLPVLKKHGMRLGDMSIFHRHADNTGKGPVMFSMANMLKPGTFSISEMESFTTPGVSFFMQLPNKFGNMHCFEQMLLTAQAVKEELDAILRDENRSVFTRQTMEHSRQRIRDFELEMLARK